MGAVKTKIEQSALLVELHISQWNPIKEDVKANKCIEQNFKTSTNAGTYKRLKFTRRALGPITSAVSEARSYHYRVTLPWKDGGVRLLPAKQLMGYTKEMRYHKQMFENAVNGFISGYQTHIADAKSMLGQLFNLNDYPIDTQKLANRYKFRFSISPIPTEKDFRINVTTAEKAQLIKHYEAVKDQAVADAMESLWHKVHERVCRMAEVLKDEKKLLRTAVVENVVDIANLLPDLNVTDDPKLTEIQKDIIDNLCGYSRDTLKEDAGLRVSQGKAAEQIANKMAMYMGTNTN